MDPGWIRVILFSFLPPCWVSVPGFDPQWRQTDRHGGGEHLSASLLPRKPCLAYLTPVSDDITRQNRPLTTRDSLQYGAWTQRQDTGVCVRLWWLRITEAETGISAVNPHRPVGSLTQLVLRQGGSYCFSILCSLFSPSLEKKSFVAGRWGSCAFWV